MSFPLFPRTVYRKNPLKEVVCQFRFPPILSIDAEIPAKFQDAIRKDYPHYNERQETQLRFPSEIADKLPPGIFEFAPEPISKKNHEFMSDDKTWKINLTRTFLALSTEQYTRWEEFKEHLEKPFQALNKNYSPVFFTRIGLRYADVFSRIVLGLENHSWSELLNSHILGLLADAEIGKSVVRTKNTSELRLTDNESVVRIVHGLIETSGSGEISYLIDSDFFIEKKLNRKEALEKLDYFNSLGSRLIRWAITDQLHNAMEPEDIL